MKTLFLTGGTGFVGRRFLDLYKEQYRIIALYRRQPGQSHDNITWIQGDLTDAVFLNHLTEIPVDAIVHIGGSSPNRAYADGHYRATTEGTRHLISFAQNKKVKRFLFLSSLSVLVTDAGPYVRSKLHAEEMIQKADIPFTILRPTVILGKGAHDFTRVARMIQRLPLFPLIHNGANRMKPISSDDIAHIMHKSVHAPEAEGRTLPVVGEHVLTQKELLHKAATIHQTSTMFIPVPLAIALPLAQMADRLNPRWGLNRERILLQSHSVEDIPHLSDGFMSGHRYQTIDEMIKRV
jgi:NADH dehydrogenase